MCIIFQASITWTHKAAGTLFLPHLQREERLAVRDVVHKLSCLEYFYIATGYRKIHQDRISRQVHIYFKKFAFSIKIPYLLNFDFLYSISSTRHFFSFLEKKQLRQRFPRYISSYHTHSMTAHAILT